ncbi:MAG: DUF6544 family protein [Actinomycetota bacterium]
MTTPEWTNPKMVAGRAAEPVAELWDRLAADHARKEQVNRAALEALPEAARRWLEHAIAPGTSAAGAVLLQMMGRIKVRRWLPFQAVQVISPEGVRVGGSRRLAASVDHGVRPLHR